MYKLGPVGFRPIEESDLETLRLIHNDVSTLLQLGNADLIAPEQQVEWWKSLHRSRSQWRFSIVELATGAVIGMMRVGNIEANNRNCEVGLDIHPDHRGRGFGEASYKALLQYLFEHFNMHMVYLRVADFNGQGKRLYEKLHFVETGRYKEYFFRHGKYWDYILMTMTVEDYKRHYPAE